MSRVASWPVRPCRPSRTWVPSSQGRRWGVRSRHQRPVRSSSSAARAGTGSAARTDCSWRSPVAGVGDDQALPDQPLAGQLQLDDHLPARPRGPSPRGGRRASSPSVTAQRPAPRRRGAHEPRRPPGPHALQPREAGEPGAVLADDAAQPRLVQRGVRDAGPVQGDQRLEVGGRQVTERRAPVQERGRTGRGGREHEAHARPRQVDRCEGHAVNDAADISPSRRRTSVRGRSSAAG